MVSVEEGGSMVTCTQACKHMCVCCICLGTLWFSSHVLHMSHHSSLMYGVLPLGHLLVVQMSMHSCAHACKDQRPRWTHV